MRAASSQSVVHWEAVQAAVDAAVQHAEALGIRINAAVADSGVNLAAFLRMPGAFLHSIAIAIDMAYTAAGFSFHTSAWGAALDMHSKGVREGLPRRPRLVAFGGGLPLRVNGELLGAIGAGDSEEQDELCARAGLTAVGAQE